MEKFFCIIVLAFGYAPVLSSQTVKDEKPDSLLKDESILTHQLQELEVKGKTNVERLRESALNVTAIDIKPLVNTSATLGDIINRAPGVRVRAEGGKGSDFELSLNGMSGNSIRYFIDGVPLETKGTGFDITNFPTNLIDRIEIYKGVVPAWLGADALGGAINIITIGKKKNYLDASVSVGSYHTYQGDITGRYTNSHGIIIQPSVSIGYAKNDYTVRGVRVWSEEDDAYISRDMKRFHDKYFSALAQIEIGVENKRWADQIYIGGSWSEVRKDLQTGAVQNVVYGKAERHTTDWNLQLRYRKRNLFTERLALNLNASYTHDNSCTIDTAYRKYSWDGSWIPTNRNEISGNARMMRHYKRPLTIVRANLDYELADWHSLNLNCMVNANGNHRYDTYDVSFDPSTDYFTKTIIGLTYTQTLVDNRLNNTLFVKDYINYVKIGQTDEYWITGSKATPRSTTKQNIGYGLGTRYSFFDELSIKGSYENTVRLPLARELLGNGTTVYPNLRLNPEKSHNFNIGLFGSVALGEAGTLTYEGDGFYRKVQDYIQAKISEAEGMMQYDNVSNVSMKGCEGQVTYNYGSWLLLSGNVSYQLAMDMNKLKSDGKPSATYKNKVPNKPWLYSNIDLTLNFDRIFVKNDGLRFNYLYQYVHWFFLTWEGYGWLETKSKIPTQNMHSAALTYSWQNDTYNLSLECNNIFDSSLYDNFMLQKPGRAFTIKFRFYLH
ncbi:MAG: TonB-dependent receptor plug domain-containing protein [Bacteroides sp.]|nr:TonB-dependent receptor plug domain-containing protein [Bacteroides sp.]